MAAESEATRTRALLHPFVGRERELDELRAGLEDALAGRGRLFLLVGEAGIGKTRLCEEISTAAESAGALVLWGRCWEGGGAPAFWPWMQILRDLADSLEPGTLAAAVGDDAALLAAVAPELVERAGLAVPGQPSQALEAEQERFPLFDAATAFLARVAARRPLALVLDDLHAADEPSLLLLEFLGRELRGAPLLVLGTCRELDAAQTPERSRRLTAIARSGHRLPLRGLSPDEVARLVVEALRDTGAEQRAGAPDLGRRLFDATGGNPFFVDELLRVITAEGGAFGRTELRIPQGIRDTVAERLRPLSADCRRVLALASVVGREFDLSLLQEMGFAPMLLLDLLGEAEAAGVVTRGQGSVPRFSFSHALVRDAIYEEVPPAQRAQWHWRAAEMLARLGAIEIEARIAELAHHALRGAVAGDASLAVDYAARAGERAAARLAFEEAAACHQQALDALALVRDPGDRRRIELLLALGQAHARGWNTNSAQETFRHAAALAQALLARDHANGSRLLARAALGFGGTGIGVPRGHTVDQTLLSLLEAALAVVGEGEPALRARLLARLAVEIYFSDSAARRASLCDDAERLARLSGDTAALAYVVSARHFASWDSPDVDHRLALANEAVGLAQRSSKSDLEVVARLWRLLDLLEKGEVRLWDVELDQLEAVARALRQPRSLSFVATLRATRALWLGRFEEVEAFWQRAIAIAERAQDRAASVNVAIQRFVLDRARGRQADLLPMLAAWVEQLPTNTTVRCMRALVHTDLGQLDQARPEFERLARADFADLQRINALGPVFPWLAEITVALGDRERAAHLTRLMQPYARQHLLGGPRVFFGPAAHWLGLLAAADDRFDDAVGDLEWAAAACRAMDGRPAATETDVELARVLLRRGRDGDRQRALGLLRRAGDTAANLGLERLRRRIADLLSEDERTPPRREQAALAVAAGSEARAPAADDAAGARTSGTTARVLRFPHKGGDRPRPAPEPHAPPELAYALRLEGEFWSVSDGESVLRLRDTKGLRYIASLLRVPEREVHVLDLIAGERPRDQAAALGGTTEPELSRLGMHTAAAGDGVEGLVDARARAAYQARLGDLREELEEATRFNDPERASRARAEIDFLAHELARAVGLGGRERATASGAERARLNVTRAVKAVIRRLAKGSPNVGRYLETTIRTGAFCSYRPDPRMRVRWKL